MTRRQGIGVVWIAIGFFAAIVLFSMTVDPINDRFGSDVYPRTVVILKGTPSAPIVPVPGAPVVPPDEWGRRGALSWKGRVGIPYSYALLACSVICIVGIFKAVVPEDKEQTEKADQPGN